MKNEKVLESIAEGQEKEHPILFSTPMVKAILEGRKTQTRRIVKEPFYSWIETATNPKWMEAVLTQCPYGQVGDILWVRETHAIEESPNEYRLVIYKATDPEYPGKWKPSIFLKRKDCRILLRIESIRIELLQDITEEDSICEGVEPDKFLDLTARENFCCLWNKINGNWDSNPFVWVISFYRAVGAIDSKTSH